MLSQPSNLGLCGSLANAYGPYDYRTDKDKLDIVEGAHFTIEVEQLIKGKGGYLGGDIDYTLRAFPNHHRALISMMRFGERVKLPRVPNARYDVECYFMRAIAFRPEDATVRMIYALFLRSKNRTDEAHRQLQAAQEYAGDSAFTHFNVGMVAMDIGDTERALQAAHRAMALGFTRTTLRDRLESAGKWREPVSSSGAASAPIAASAAGSGASAP